MPLPLLPDSRTVHKIMGTERISLSSDAFVGKDRQTRSVEIGEASPELVMSGRRLVTGKELAEWLGVPYTWVREHTRKRCLDPIPHFALGRYVRFDLSSPALANWLHEQARGGENNRKEKM